MIIDTHCHLNDEKFADNVKNIIDNFKIDNVRLAICNSSSFKDFNQLLQMSKEYSNIYCTLGIHPHEANTWNEKVKSFILNNAQNDKVVAIGEIGLDYYYDFCDRTLQKQVMMEQILLAHSLKLPMVFHIRDAMGDFLQIVRENLNLFEYGAEIHSFSGSVEVAKELISYGFYLGFNGIITFKNANKILDVIKFVPLKNVLIETDAPYLTPEPYRGKINEPKYTHIIASKIAQIKQLDVNIVENQANQNAYNLFKKLYK